ncbi:glycosyltransferase family 4 protein [Psychromonas aquatilis]|uniref:Glycosyltransferase family 4 protein n=1 Tax=Psychromonas aquatilis TaxID=2005072 RepID=A0ABU9GL55_9GAMM
MHICHVNLASGFSGGERQTLQLIKQQVVEGYQLTVVANPKSPFVDEIKKLPVKLVLASHFTGAHHKKTTVDCDLIHVHEGRAIYWALIQKCLFNVPYIITRRIDNPLKDKWLANRAYSNASCLIGLSTAIVDAIKLRHPQANIQKIPSSPVFYPANEKFVAEIKTRFKGKKIIIQASNLLKHKGHRTSIEAFKLLEITQPDLHLVLLGEGPEKESLLAQSTGMKNITFAGKQSDMGSWFTAADLLIHPSDSEGLGSVILEAIKAGLPVIGSNAGGIPDIIEDRVSGLLIEAKNGESLASAIVAITSDSDLKACLQDGAQEKLKEFDITFTSSLYNTIYQSVK